MTYFLLFLLFYLKASDFPQCFDEEIKPARYANTNNIVSIPDPIFIHSGGWLSQLAINTLFKIIFREKVGLEFTFYPEVPDVTLSLF